MTSLADTNEATLITASDTSVFIVGSIVVANTHASTTSSITLTVTDTSAAADFNIVTSQSFTALTAQEILNRPMVIENLDVLKAQAADANIFDIIVSYLDRDRT
jgi:hypothetical protein